MERRVVCMLALLVVLPACFFGQAPATVDRDLALRFLQEYCSAEARGERDFRVMHTKWDDTSLDELRRYNDMEPGYFNLINDPLMVISGFDIVDVFVSGNCGRALVRYHTLATTDGVGAQRRLVFERKDIDDVLHWSYSDGQFFVHNPMVAKVLLKSVILEFEQSYEGMYSLSGGILEYRFPKDWKEDSPGARKARKNIADLVKLKSFR